MESKGTQALDRGLALFAAVVRDDGVTPAATLGTALGIAPSSARRMLAALERHGLITRIAHGRYAGTDRLAQLAARIAPHRRLTEAARPELRRMVASEQATAHLGIFDGDMVTYLVKEGATSLFTREHGQLEAYCTGIGKALLAQLPEGAVETYLSGSFVRLTDQTLTDATALREEIAMTRARGYAIDNCEIADDLACVAVPLDTGGPTIAAISFSGHPTRVRVDRPERVARRLQACAVAIAKRLRV